MLTRKDMKWVWEKSQQKAFDELKGIFTTKPVLVVPDLDKEFRVEVSQTSFGHISIKSLTISTVLRPA